MPGRLDQIESMLHAQLGGTLLAQCPELIYSVNQVLVRFGRTQDTLLALWRQLDSALFNAIYTGTKGSMLVTLDDGTRMRATSERIRDLSDRLLALAYQKKDASPALQEALFDFSRAGSFAAMRELAARFPLEASERAYIMQVLKENDQMQ